MKKSFIKMLCLLVLGVSLVQCSSNNTKQEDNNQVTVSPYAPLPEDTTINLPEDFVNSTGKEKIPAHAISGSKYQSVVPIVSASDDKYVGTGTIIGKNTILTNKHVTDMETKDTLYVLLNEDDKTIKFEIENIIEFDEEANGEDGQNADLSIIQVKPNNGRNISDEIETFEFATAEEVKGLKTTDSIEYAGYPGDLQPDLYADTREINLIDGNYISFNSLAEGGQSGSALLNSENKIVGLVRASNDKEGIGFLFNQTTLDFVNENIK